MSGDVKSQTPTDGHGQTLILGGRVRRPKGKALARAAASYLAAYTEPDTWNLSQGRLPGPLCDWPFPRRDWKPSKNAIENLEKACELIHAEIDRLKAKEAAV